jgi:predicted dehydrogenase
MTRKSIYISRRRFLQNSATVAAAGSLPAWCLSACATTGAPNVEAKSPNEKIQLALIGCGGQGTYDALNSESAGAKIVAVCDVDANHVKKAQERFDGAAGYHDFRDVLERKDVDGVICGTVDHWHTLVAMATMRAGKDIYCEKPMTLCIDEGKHVVKVQKKTGRVLQTGTQQRSSVYFRLACDLIRNDRIGKVQMAEVWLPAGLRRGPFKSTPIPKGFDYDFWMGQTPEVPYVKERTHFSFRYWWEYSGGTMTDWGAHHNDIVSWVLDMDNSGPVSVEGKQLVDMIPGGFTAASEYALEYKYANGVIHKCNSTTASEWNGEVKDPNGQLHGIKFTGTDGWIWVTRGEIKASDSAILKEKLPDNAPRVYESNNHMENFLDCMRTRKVPICPADVGHRSATVAHLGVLAIRMGRKLQWDPEKERFIGDAEAQSHVKRPMRKDYDYDMV